MFDVKNSILERINIADFTQRGITLYVKRDDLIHAEVSGNKWRKLKFNAESCLTKKKKGILTFGGAYSNHLLATASACSSLGLESIGIVRGEELNENSNGTLKNCAGLGMRLIFVSRAKYELRHEKAFIEAKGIEFPNFLILPEGGANYLGMIGCQELISEIKIEFDAIFVAQGTATTSCGVAMGLNANQEIHVVPALKGYQSIDEMDRLLIESGIDEEWRNQILDKVIVHSDYHFGGYGRYTHELLLFIKEFNEKHGLKLDPIYTGKTMFALVAKLKEEVYNNKTVVFIHTGGLQGVSSIEEKSGFKLF